MRKTAELPRFRFTEDEPTPIVRDFKAFVNYIEETPFALTKKAENIPYKHLVALNEMMSSPNGENTPRTPQQYYPRLHLFHNLALAGSLFQRAQSRSSIVLEPTDRLDAFRSLSDPGKYFFLLETLWVDCLVSELSFDSDSPRRGSVGIASGLAHLLELLSKSEPGRKLSGVSLRGITFIIDGLLLLCIPLFGWYDFVRDTSGYEVKSWFAVTSLTPSHLGVTVSKILLEERPFVEWNLPYRRRMGEIVDYPGQDPEGGQGEYVPFVEAFRKICEDGESLDALPRRMREHTKGNFVFKVSLDDELWRTIAISSEDTLDDLHLMIQDAFRFDRDHLYAFFMDNRRWSDYSFEHPFSQDAASADDVLIGDLDLVVNQSILYLFDFGDEWTFDVKLMEIRTHEPLLPRPKIMKRKGRSPEQYPSYDF